MNSLIDSNIIIYSVYNNHTHQETARSILKEEDEFYVSIQNIVESYRSLTSSRDFSNPLSAGLAMSELDTFTSNVNVVYPRSSTYTILKNLLLRYNLTSYQVFDTFLVSYMLDYGIDRIYTNNDKDFKKFEEIEVINPFKKN